MRQMRRVEAFEVLEQPHRVEARLTCGHVVESWAGQHIGALRRCRACERAGYIALPASLPPEEEGDCPAGDPAWEAEQEANLPPEENP